MSKSSFPQVMLYTLTQYAISVSILVRFKENGGVHVKIEFEGFLLRLLTAESFPA